MVRMPEVEKKRTKKTRRRFDLALNIPGAEVRLPSLPYVHVGTRLVSFILVLLLSVLIYHFWNSPLYQPDGAQVRGLKRLKSNDVNAVLNISGTPVFMIDPDQVERELLSAFPEFSAVSASVSLPRSLEVEVIEREPVLTWRQGDRTELVDVDGYAFPFRIEATALITPVVEAYGNPRGFIAPDTKAMIPELIKISDVKSVANNLIFGETPDNQRVYAQRLLSPEMVAAIRTIARLIPVNTPLLYDPQHGFGWHDERGWQVFLGDASDIEMKLRVYENIVKQLFANELQPILVSVEHVHNPYYRLEP